MSQVRKIARNGKTLVEIETWARRSYEFKYGKRAAAMAVVCRRNGLRDLVVPVADLEETLPKLASRVSKAPTCQHGGMFENAGARSARCRELATLIVITDSGLELFFCESHAEERVVRMPT